MTKSAPHKLVWERCINFFWIDIGKVPLIRSFMDLQTFSVCLTIFCSCLHWKETFAIVVITVYFIFMLDIGSLQDKAVSEPASITGRQHSYHQTLDLFVPSFDNHKKKLSRGKMSKYITIVNTSELRKDNDIII